eukprot:Sspe_Gene.55210::Locus_30391_Transcript_1_1_Confidence_1.000_Length_558::g.55210::m.55210
MTLVEPPMLFNGPLASSTEAAVGSGQKKLSATAPPFIPGMGRAAAAHPEPSMPTVSPPPERNAFSSEMLPGMMHDLFTHLEECLRANDHKEAKLKAELERFIITTRHESSRLKSDLRNVGEAVTRLSGEIERLHQDNKWGKQCSIPSSAGSDNNHSSNSSSSNS